MKTIVFDMYGVILEESKGYFIPYTHEHFPQEEHARLRKLFREENLFTRAGNGEINSHQFLTQLGFADPDFHMRDYIENYLTMDRGFYAFAAEMAEMKSECQFALLSNDVADWSRHITAYHDLDRYFTAKIVSGDVHCRKPEPRIYEIALETLCVSGDSCIFIDNSVKNLRVAQTFGMDTILFNRDGEEFDGKTVYSFAELSALMPNLLS